MESGKKIEASESKTHPISSTGKVGSSTPNKKLGSSLSLASDSSVDSSFELIINEPGDFFGCTSASLHVAGHSDSEFEFISGDGIEICSPLIDLPSAAKISNRSLSRSSSSASSVNDHVIELRSPVKYKDTKAMEPESRKKLQTCYSTLSSSSSESESGHKTKRKQKDNRLVTDFGEDVPINSGSEGATRYPPTQMMDRADDPSSPYRIPSRVFSRTKSTAPMEWSVASNESLFSIQMGNMSFTREQLCWLGKSGELYRPGESGFDASQPLQMKPSDCGLKGARPDGDLAATEARAAETMREVIRENSENQRKESSTLTESSSQSASISHQSEGSTKSFQFPILTGDGGKSISLKGGDPEKAKKDMKPESPHPANPQTPKESSSDGSPKAATNVGQKKWFSCFSCCPLCS